MVFSVIFSCLLGYSIENGFHSLSVLYVIVLSIIGLLCVGSLLYLYKFDQPGTPVIGFKCPLVPLVPSLSIFFNFLLATQTDMLTWINLMGFEAIGILIYFFYGYKNSKLN